MHAWGWRDTLKSLEKVICFSNPKPTPFISFTFATIHVWERRKHSRIFVNLYLFFKPKTHFIYPIHICHDPCVRVAITPSHVCEFYLFFEPNNHFSPPSHLPRSVRESDTTLSHICTIPFFFWIQKPLLTAFTFAMIHAWEWSDTLTCMLNFVCVLNPKPNSHHHHICHNPCMRVTRCSRMIAQSYFILRPKITSHYIHICHDPCVRKWRDILACL